MVPQICGLPKFNDEKYTVLHSEQVWKGGEHGARSAHTDESITWLFSWSFFITM